MAYAGAQTMIPLDRLAYHLQIDPYHFNGITSDTRRNAFACDDTWTQHDWQASGKLSRESVALALKQAEEVTVSYLGWSPVPRWYSEEVMLPDHYKPERHSFYNARGLAKSVVTQYGFVTETGRRTSSLVQAGVATAFSDVDGDGFDETVTVTVATTVTDEDELHIYYPNKSGREEWEIRPVTSITIAGGIATIVFPKYLIALENLIEQIPEPGDAHILIDGDDNANFLQTVDVYRVYADPSQQITFHFDPSQTGCASTPCELDTETGCLFIRDARRGILAYRRADWDADTEAYVNKSFTYIPIKGTIYYRAGKTDERLLFPNREMELPLERLICFYALSLLDQELCGCSNTRNTWQYMTEDISRVTNEGSHVVHWDDLRNSFGTTRAAFLLWKYVFNVRISRSQIPR